MRTKRAKILNLIVFLLLITVAIRTDSEMTLNLVFSPILILSIIGLSQDSKVIFKDWKPDSDILLFLRFLVCFALIANDHIFYGWAYMAALIAMLVKYKFYKKVK